MAWFAGGDHAKLLVLSTISTRGVILVLIAVAMVAGLAGFFVGRAGVLIDAAPAPPTNSASADPRLTQHGPMVAERVGPDAGVGATKQRNVADRSGAAMTLSQALALADPKNRDRQLENILAGASLSDVKEGLDWALALPEGFPKLAVMRKIMDRWGQLDGPDAAAYGEEVLAATGRPDLLEEALRGWGQNDPGASLGYAQSMAVGNDVRRDVSRAIIRDWADRSPQAAADFAAANQMDVGRGGWPGVIADRWSKQDPSSAAAWAASLPDGQAQRRAYDEVVQNWCDLNVQSAADFVTSQPAGPNKDVMLSTLAREVARLDQASALQWASTITDAAMQEDTAWSIMRRSVRDDPAAALQLLQNSGLPATVQETLSTRISASQNQGPGIGGR